MKKPLFTGTATALVTPFDKNRVNFEMLEKIIIRQLDAGIQTIVLCGTTGESSTLTDAEKTEIFNFSKRLIGRRAVLIAGTGSNDTRHACTLSEAAQKAGMDALLIVSPYYNKSNAAGLIAHYREVAGNVSIPIIAYNVPSRTGVNIPIEVYCALSETENIIGVKEASGSIQTAMDIRLSCPKDFYIWSGNDDLTVPLMSVGAVGVISVASNVEPAKVNEMTNAALSGNISSASALQMELMPLIKALFSDVNPIPVKRAMKEIGFDCGQCRLPLAEMSDEKIKMLQNILKK